MSYHPIEGLMSTAMQSIKEMVDVNTIVGEPVQSPDGTVIIPISRVTFGFAAGGSEFRGVFEEEKGAERNEEVEVRLPFGGGSGAGVCIHPMAFLVVNKDNIKLLPINVNASLDKVLDFIPEMVEKLNETVKKRINGKKDMKETKNEHINPGDIVKKDSLLD